MYFWLKVKPSRIDDTHVWILKYKDPLYDDDDGIICGPIFIKIDSQRLMIEVY